MDNSAMYCYFSITHYDAVNISGKCFFQDLEQYFSLTDAWQNVGFDMMHILYLSRFCQNALQNACDDLHTLQKRAHFPLPSATLNLSHLFVFTF